MPRFEELQQLWQAQPQVQPPPEELARLGRSVRQYAMRMNRVYAAKTAVAAAIFAWTFSRFHGSPLMLATLALLVVMVGAVLFLDWRDQQAIAHMDFTQVSVEFVRQAGERLSWQREHFARRYFALMVGVAVIENMVAIASSHGLSWKTRVLWHAAATAAPFPLYYLGRWVRAQRFERDARPIVDQLSAMARALEESER